MAGPTVKERIAEAVKQALATYKDEVVDKTSEFMNEYDVDLCEEGLGAWATALRLPLTPRKRHETNLRINVDLQTLGEFDSYDSRGKFILEQVEVEVTRLIESFDDVHEVSSVGVSFY